MSTELNHSALPEPWEKQAVHFVGGLQAVGFSQDQSFLLVVSTSGRSVIDLKSFEKVARDRNSVLHEFSDNNAGTVLGIGPIENEVVSCVALWDGWSRELSSKTNDGWQIDLQDEVTTFLVSPDEQKYSLLESAGEFVTVGFTDIGTQLVVASTADLFIYGRVET